MFNLKAQCDIKDLVSLLHYQAEIKGNNLAFNFLDVSNVSSTYTYQKLHSEAVRIAGLLQAVIKPGDRALVMFKPGLEFISAYFGCLYAGVIAVPAYPPVNDAMAERLSHIMLDCTPAAILTSQDIKDKLTQVKMLKFVRDIGFKKIATKLYRGIDKVFDLNIKKLKFITTDYHTSTPWKPVNIKPNDIAFLQYTSGSTDLPKGVIITHANILDNLSHIAKAFDIHGDDIGTFWLPPYHDMGLIGGILGTVYNGMSSYLFSPYEFLINPLKWLKVISENHATISGGPNFAYELCVNKIPDECINTLDLSSWRTAFSGAEPIAIKILHKFADKFKKYHFRAGSFITCYGLAEATLLVSAIKHEPDYVIATAANMEPKPQELINDKVFVSSGKPYVKVKIVDPNSLQELADGGTGEIWIQGESISQSYWDKGEVTQKTFMAKLNNSNDKAGYLRTGDLGFIVNGKLFVNGRVKEIIIIRGVNYYPNDFEQLINESHPAIISGRTIAFSEEVYGQEELVIVCETKIRQPGVYQAIVEAIKSTLLKAANLKVYKIVIIPKKSVPKTLSGKLQRCLCKKNLAENKFIILHQWYDDMHDPHVTST